MADSAKRAATPSVFDPDNSEGYKAYREKKLAESPRLGQLIVEINNPADLTDSEKNKIISLCRRFNLALYATSSSINTDTESIRKFGQYFGLKSLDSNPFSDDEGISTLTVKDSRAGDFIPYTNKAIQWHTDGYYNDPNHYVRAMLLHCVHQAENGGENAFLDHEIAYIHLRDENPDYIRVLMEKDVMSIPPALDESGNELRPVRIGPVFSIADDGSLHMRYTARTRSIHWKKSLLLEKALASLQGLVNSNSPYILRARLQNGQGIVCNNVLHNRSSFTDDGNMKRLYFRARYHERMADTQTV